MTYGLFLKILKENEIQLDSEENVIHVLQSVNGY